MAHTPSADLPTRSFAKSLKEPDFGDIPDMALDVPALSESGQFY